MTKPKLAMYWASSCGGCDVAVLDTNEKLLDIAGLVDIVFWPIAMDIKYRRIEEMEDGTIDLCLYNGAIMNDEQEKFARLFRAKSKVLVAFGACSCFGGIPSLSNFSTREEILQRVYTEIPSNDNQKKVLPQASAQVPEGELTLPVLTEDAMSLEQVVPVDYFVPGCPPPVNLILRVIDLYVSGKMPEHGSVIASDKTCCDECDRIKENKIVDHFHRPHEIIPDPTRCLLEQGIICMGPATRGGCGMGCVNANMPCRGCFGPPDGILDQGAAMLSAIASINQGETPQEIQQMLDEIVDPAGTFYRFGMAESMLKRKRPMKDNNHG